MRTHERALHDARVGGKKIYGRDSTNFVINLSDHGSLRIFYGWCLEHDLSLSLFLVAAS